MKNNKSTNNMRLTPDEQETTMTWDYPAGVVRVYTTKETVINDIRKRLGGKLSECVEWGRWAIDIPIEYVRSPQLVLKVRS